MNEFKEDSTFLKINSTTFYVKGYEEYNVRDRRKEVSESIDIVHVRTQEKIIITQENYEEFEVEIRKKTDNFTEDDLKELHEKIINYETESSNQFIAELIIAISFKESLGIEVIKEDARDFRRLVDTGASYHLANQMNYIEGIKSIKDIMGKIDFANFIAQQGDKLIKGIASDGLKRAISGEGKEVLLEYVKRRTKTSVKQNIAMLGVTTYFINKMAKYIKETEDFFKSYGKYLSEGSESFKVLFCNLIKDDKVLQYIKENQSGFNENWKDRIIDSEECLATVLQMVTINGLFEENINDLEEFFKKSLKQHVMSFLILNELEALKEAVNPLHYDETVKNLIVEKVSEFFSVWNLALIELMGKSHDYIGKPMEVLVRDYLEIVNVNKKISKLSKLIIEVGVIITETAAVITKGAMAATSIASLWQLLIPGGSVKQVLTLGATATGAFWVLKRIGQMMILYASSVSEMIYKEEKSFSSLFPLLEFFKNGMDFDYFNVYTNSLETFRINREWPRKLDVLMRKVLSSENFQLKIGDIDEIDAKLVKVVTTVGAFEKYYQKTNRDETLENFTLYYTDKDEEIEERIRDLFYIESEEEFEEDILEFENLIFEKIENANNFFSDERKRKIFNLVATQSKEDWLTTEDFNMINEELFKETYKENLFYITFFGKYEEQRLTVIKTEDIQLKSPFEILNLLYKENREFYDKYVKELLIEFEKEPLELKKVLVEDKATNTDYGIREVNYIRNRINEIHDTNIRRNKDLFLYSEYSYYIDRNMVGSIETVDFDYILCHLIVDGELMAMVNYGDFRDLFLNLRGSVGIDNSQLVHQEILNEIDVEYKEKTSGDDKELDQLRGYGILKWKGKRLGENLEFAYDDKKNFWEREQEYSFEVFKDSEGLLYFYNRRNNFLKIKKIEDDKEDILVTIRDFNNCDYGIEIPKKITVINMKDISVGGAKVIETHYYETATYDE